MGMARVLAHQGCCTLVTCTVSLDVRPCRPLEAEMTRTVTVTGFTYWAPVEKVDTHYERDRHLGILV